MTHTHVEGLHRLTPTLALHGASISSSHDTRLIPKTQYVSRQGELNQLDGNVRIRLLFTGKNIFIGSRFRIQAYWFPFDFRM